MAASIAFEDESGTSTPFRETTHEPRRHNGDWAGNFSSGHRDVVVDPVRLANDLRHYAPSVAVQR